jgi:hypothetical protein
MGLTLIFHVLPESIMTKKQFAFSAFFAVASIWWGWTILINFFIVPKIFSHIDQFFKAGELAIKVFSSLNNLELIASSALVVLISYLMKSDKSYLKLMLLTIALWLIAFSYFALLTPKIESLTALWNQTDMLGITGVAGIPDIQQEHQKFHNLYIGLDIFKLTLLTAMIFLCFVKQEKRA